MIGKVKPLKSKPSKEEVAELWSNIWHKETNYNTDAKWLENLEKSYCANIRQRDYAICEEVFNDVHKYIKDRGTPGPNRIQCFWMKTLLSTHKYMITEYGTF